MQTKTVKQVLAVLLVAGTGAWSLHAQSSSSVDQVVVKDGKPFLVQGHTTNAVVKELAFTKDVRVMTNCTFRVKEGKERQLQEGQVLDAEGMLTSPDGSVVPVADHVAMKRGSVVVVRDGEESKLAGELTLGNGCRVTADGYYVKPGWAETRLLDGQMFGLDGQPIAARDTITLKAGRVRVQKDGSQLDVPPDRNLMMNDGTKVFGDGTVVLPDGTTRKLTEGEVLAVQGVVRR